MIRARGAASVLDEVERPPDSLARVEVEHADGQAVAGVRQSAHRDRHELTAQRAVDIDLLGPVFSYDCLIRLPLRGHAPQSVSVLKPPPPRRGREESHDLEVAGERL